MIVVSFLGDIEVGVRWDLAMSMAVMNFPLDHGEKNKHYFMFLIGLIYRVIIYSKVMSFAQP